MDRRKFVAFTPWIREATSPFEIDFNDETFGLRREVTANHLPRIKKSEGLLKKFFDSRAGV